MSAEQYPSGNVTFVFTDIEGSSAVTRRLEERGPQLYETHLRDPHRQRLRELVQQHGGFEVQRAGDGHMFVFALADDALACVVAFQQSLAAQPISLAVEGQTWTVRVRIGVHTAGRQRQPQPMENGLVEYPGSDTNYAARLGALGAGGQILISEHTSRAAPSIGTYRLQPWPNRYLKSFDEAPQTVYELLYQPGQAPREPGISFFPEFYEGERNRYIPREEKEAEVLAHFTDRRRDSSPARLVTIKAEGGMGKTRLAVACAVKLVGAFEHGVHFVGLAGVSPSVEAVAEAIGRALHLPPEASRPEELYQALRSRSTLLLLDNIESVHCEAVGRFLARLATETSGISLLAAGRKALGVSDVEQLVSLEEGMTDSEAQALFIARARLKQRLTGDLSPIEEAQLARIVALTERIPLALELAAAWTEYLELREIADGIEQTPLGEETRLPPDEVRADDMVTFERHRSLERSLDWSYQLLGQREGPTAQAVFAASSLFADTFDAPTVAAVSAERSARIELIRLQNASLVRRVATEGTTRYHLHRFTREYATNRLAELPTADDIRRRFVEHYVRLVQENGEKLSELDSLAVLDREWRNAAAAAGVAELMQDHQAVQELALTAAFLDQRGLWTEAERLCLRALAAARAAGERPGAGRLLTRLGYSYLHQGRWDEAVAVYEQALTIFREFHDRRGEGRALNNLGIIYRHQRRWEEAIIAYQQSLAIKRELQDRRGEGLTLNNLGIVYTNQGRWEEAIAALEQDLAICREFGDRLGEGKTLHSLGSSYLHQGRWEEAIAAFQQDLAICREFHDRLGEAVTLSSLGSVYRHQGRREGAMAVLEDALAIFREFQDHVHAAEVLQEMALLREAHGDTSRALTLARQAVGVLEGTQAAAALAKARELLARLERIT